MTNRRFPSFALPAARRSRLAARRVGRMALRVALVGLVGLALDAIESADSALLPRVSRAGGSATACATGCGTTWTGSVGAVLGKDNADGRLFVREVPRGMGAAHAGMAVGDEVVAIEGRPVEKMSPAEVHEALSGKVGTRVKVTVLRSGVRIDCDVERGPLSGT